MRADIGVTLKPTAAAPRLIKTGCMRRLADLQLKYAWAVDGGSWKAVG